MVGKDFTDGWFTRSQGPVLCGLKLFERKYAIYCKFSLISRFIFHCFYSKNIVLNLQLVDHNLIYQKKIKLIFNFKPINNTLQQEIRHHRSFA